MKNVEDEEVTDFEDSKSNPQSLKKHPRREDDGIPEKYQGKTLKILSDAPRS
jgi:hypothetical protein